MRKRRTHHRAYRVHRGQPLFLRHGHCGALPEKHFGAKNEGLGPLADVWGPSGDPGGDLLRFGSVSPPKPSSFWQLFLRCFWDLDPKTRT